MLLPIALPVGGMAAGLFCVAHTAGGRLMGMTCLLVVIAGLHALLKGKQRWGVSLGLSGIGLACWLGALALTPSAANVRETGLSVYLGDASHTRSALTQMVPEVDQFTLGSYLAPLADPVIDRAQSKRIRRLFQAVYDELRADPDFAQAGSVMGDAYAELWGGQWRNDHLFRYPAAGNASARPVLLFLHGSAGNFLGYLWVLKAFADRAGWAVVAPDFGFGNWHRHPIAPTLDKTLAYIDAQPDLDGTRIMLMGLSNGGRGVTRVARAYPERFGACVLFSPVIEAYEDLPVTTPWFVLHGDTDRRIPTPFVTRPVAQMKARGIPVELTMIPGDHFIFFERRDVVLDTLMRASQAALR